MGEQTVYPVFATSRGQKMKLYSWDVFGISLLKFVCCGEQDGFNKGDV